MNLLARQQNGLLAMASGALGALIIMAIVLIAAVIAGYGSAYFWPSPLYQVSYQAPNGPATFYVRVQTRDFQGASDHPHWVMTSHSLEQFGPQQFIVETHKIEHTSQPETLSDILLRDGNRLYAAMLAAIKQDQRLPLDQLPVLMETVSDKVSRIEQLQQDKLAPIHQRLAQLDRRQVEPQAPARQALQATFVRHQQQWQALKQELAQYQLLLQRADGSEFRLPMAKVDQYWRLNQLSLPDKISVFASKLWHFVSEGPKSSNDTGGVFPALFGTVVMVLLMTVLVTPLGVIAALYLSEYAPDNALTSMIRIGVNNLAGVPSIVYGVFGLGFWVYIVGGQIDQWLFSDHLPAPTFGSPGLFWASLTMAMLTLPVVIVATEEGLRRVPKSVRHGSFALGATKFETVWNTVLPMASPGIMTGVILAIARGAGEVAPLLLVGAVKFAPSLPVDGEFPYLHLDRQFMHLGVLIYDGAFHSNHFAQSGSMLFATCLLLLLIVVVLNVIAVMVRARLRQRYQSLVR